MFPKLQLYLAFSITDAFEKACQKTNPYLFKFFTSGNEYLEEILIAQKKYLAKACIPCSTVEALEGLEKHVLSILKQLAPSFAFTSEQFFLIARGY
jgi:hypothetical protein